MYPTIWAYCIQYTFNFLSLFPGDEVLTDPSLHPGGFSYIKGSAYIKILCDIDVLCSHIDHFFNKARLPLLGCRCKSLSQNMEHLASLKKIPWLGN